jgi:hypothetical protein
MTTCRLGHERGIKQESNSAWAKLFPWLGQMTPIDNLRGGEMLNPTSRSGRILRPVCPPAQRYALRSSLAVTGEDWPEDLPVGNCQNSSERRPTQRNRQRAMNPWRRRPSTRRAAALTEPILPYGGVITPPHPQRPARTKRRTSGKTEMLRRATLSGSTCRSGEPRSGVQT